MGEQRIVLSKVSIQAIILQGLVGLIRLQDSNVPQCISNIIEMENI